MSKHYFTFGFAHAHAVNGRTWDKDCVCVIEAPDEGAARARMVETFGLKWSMQYSMEPTMSYFPRGLMMLDSITENDVRDMLRALAGGRSSRDEAVKP